VINFMHTFFIFQFPKAPEGSYTPWFVDL